MRPKSGWRQGWILYFWCSHVSNVSETTREVSGGILPPPRETHCLMHFPIRQTRSHLMDLFEQQGLHPRGDLGQNFLIDLNLLESIVTEADLGPDDVVLEVGAGTGGLTTYLVAEAGAVVSVEYDPNMYRLTNEVTSHLPDLTLLNCDALKNKNQLNPLVTDAVSAYLAVDPARRLKLVANLPYHIGTPVIANLLASDYPWSRMVVTIQYEMAQRLNAKPGTSDYGALSVFVQAQCTVKLVHKLPPSVFWPRPKVDSAIVRIDPDPQKAALIHDRAALHVFLRDVFGQRRKVLGGVLAQMYKGRMTRAAIDSVLHELKLPSDARAEALEVAQLVELSNRLQPFVESTTLNDKGRRDEIGASEVRRQVEAEDP